MNRFFYKLKLEVFVLVQAPNICCILGLLTTEAKNQIGQLEVVCTNVNSMAAIMIIVRHL